MTNKMQRIVLASRPRGAASSDNFRLETADIPAPGPGEVLVRTLFLSLDPYMRGRMSAAKSYSAPVEVGATMGGGTVSEVVDSNAAGVRPGDIVLGMGGWATHAVLPADQVRKVDPAVAPVSTALGVLGMPGFTGWYGLTQIGRPKPGETLVVGAATGPVGSMVGQLARAGGLRAVGVAGGAEKCRFAVEQLGFDACIDHRAHASADSLREALKDAAPDGIDIYFENVAGKTLEAVLPQMNVHGRIPLCGTVAWYQGGSDADHDQLPAAWRGILTRRLTVGGFIIADHYDRFPAFLGEVAPQVASGRIVYREDVAEGLENAPEAFLGMLKGRNFGKQLVRVAG
ncbi:zinc-binding dehydrogenase [Rhodobacteraceae bacterium 2CG4]|uniref:Zinc-binding dehydrogenase n=1 Tax=Halovulum marinum TaxID=2662447 RepID=A0A6L5Z4M3_9RHOB|nr:NADP-dependent oxidoreductase [Halovulum marinum]MSU91279.1 zinc-binding dehydrogenase [Halovulum marinum]